LVLDEAEEKEFRRRTEDVNSLKLNCKLLYVPLQINRFFDKLKENRVTGNAD